MQMCIYRFPDIMPYFQLSSNYALSFGWIKTILTLLVLALTGWQAIGRDNKLAKEKFKYRNTIQLEAFGPGAFYSLNYERNVVNLPRIKTSFQVGGAYYPPSTGVITLSFPLRIAGLYSFRQHHIECGIGAIVTFSDEDNGKTRLRDYDFEPFLTFALGYRYQKPQSRWQLKVLFTPVLELEDRNEFIPTGALTLGFNF